MFSVCFNLGWHLGVTLDSALRITPGTLEGPYRMPEIEPGPIVCKPNTLSPVLSLQGFNVFQVLKYDNNSRSGPEI